MKTLFRNKKLMTGVITVMVGVTILLAGIAFAWFFGVGGDPGEDFLAGDMDVVVDLNLDDDIFWRPILPGDTDEGVGVIYAPDNNPLPGTDMHFDNPFTAMFSVDAAKIVKRDGTLGDPTVLTFVVDEKGRDGVAWPLGEWVDFSNADYTKWSMYNWMKGKDGNYYVEMYGNDKLHFAYEVIADGYKMDNSYRGAKISMASHYSWVQNRNIEAALKETRPDASGPNVGRKASDGFVSLAAWITAGNSYLSYFDFFYVNGDHAYPVYVDIQYPVNNIIYPGVHPGPTPGPFNVDDDFRANLEKFYNSLPEGSRGKAFLAEYYGL